MFGKDGPEPMQFAVLAKKVIPAKGSDLNVPYPHLKIAASQD
jgi:hypothetical protein